MRDYMAAARVAWQAWAGESDRQRAGAEAFREQGIHEWAEAEPRRRSIELPGGPTSV